MGDLFNGATLVFYSELMNNFLIYTPPSFGMFATLEGSSHRKMCVSEKHFMKEYDLVYIGEF